MTNQVLLEFLNIGGSEFMLIAVAILLLFGGKKLPELARGLGRGIREFNDASEGVKREIHRNINAVTSDLTDKQEEAIQKNHLHPEEPAMPATENAQTDTYIPADQLEVERVIAERLAQSDRIAPEGQQSLADRTEATVKPTEANTAATPVNPSTTSANPSTEADQADTDAQSLRDSYT